MATFRSFGQSSLQKLMGIEQKNQEMDVIVLLAKQRKFIVIEVKSDNSGRVPSNALTTLQNTKTFAKLVFNILGITLSEQWEYKPLVALPNVKSRDKLDRKYYSQEEHISQVKHILTKTELNSDLLSSVADPDPVFFGHPDPDPGKYRIQILYPQKDPMLFKFSCYKIVAL